MDGDGDDDEGDGDGGTRVHQMSLVRPLVASPPLESRVIQAESRTKTTKSYLSYIRHHRHKAGKVLEACDKLCTQTFSPVVFSMWDRVPVLHAHRPPPYLGKNVIFHWESRDFADNIEPYYILLPFALLSSFLSLS